MPVPLKPPLWRQQAELPKLHNVGIDKVAHELSDWLNELPPNTNHFEPDELDVVAARVIAIYLRSVRGED